MFSYGRIFYYTHYSKNPTIQQSTRTIGTGPPLRYIASGDSTAVGVGASSVENTYPYKITEKLGKTNSITYHNIALSGARTKNVIDSQLQPIIEFNPDIVTISIGANDATHLTDEQTIINNYKQIIQRLTNETSAKIYITNIANFNGARLLPLPFVKFIEWRSKQINPEIIALETDRVKIINIHDFGWNNYPDKQVTYSFDHFHPSDIGYENWTNAFLDKIQQ